MIALNKWDHLTNEQKDNTRTMVDRKLSFLSEYVPIRTISARHGTGVGKCIDHLARIYDSIHQDLSTSSVNRILQSALEGHQPPAATGRRIKCRYAHVGSRHPFTIVVHGTQVDKLPDSYQRYLAKTYRKAFKLEGVPINIIMRNSDNPYVGKE